MVRRVAVVGAGSSGLACVKVCIDEGLEPVCFEGSDDIGGLWKFKESTEPDQASIYRSLVTNTSKEIMCFSDFPMPAEYPNYLHNSELLQYFRLYADHFHLHRHIRFQTRVKRVVQRPDFSASGQWDVVTMDKDGREERHVFDAVLVCSGQYVLPSLPLSDFPGHDTFTGTCIHSRDYKDGTAFRGKRVMVVGIGNSGGDIASEISRHAAKTFLSTRKGAWVIGRMFGRGIPVDLIILNRFKRLLLGLLPRTVANWAAERSLNSHCDHRFYGLQPTHRFFDRKPLVNEDLLGQILQGRVVVKPDLKAFTSTGVMFEDGTVEENIDAVVFCTGFKDSFPFLPPSLFDGPKQELQLYKRLFPVSLSPPTLAVMGLFQAAGPIMTVVEMQARWAVKVFTGQRSLPSLKQMLQVTESDTIHNRKSSPRESDAARQIDYMSYLDFMAGEVGALPNLWWLLLTDPLLWTKVFFGPCTPYQYRLSGPGQWAGARQAILTQWERVAQPFRTRAVPQPEAGPSLLPSYKLLLIGGSVLAAGLLLKSETVPGVLQGAAQALDKCKFFLSDAFFSLTR